MPGHSFLIRFPDERSRAVFRSALEDSRVGTERLHFGEFLPDVIVQDISDQEADRLRSLAGPRARFFEDIQFEVQKPSRSSS